MTTCIRSGRRIRMTLLVLNGVGALVATGFAAAGLVRPAVAERRSDTKTDSVTEFWAASSAIRTLAITGPLLATLLTRRGPSGGQIVAAAGIVQLGDAALGLRQRNPFMAIAPAVMGTIHLITARSLSRMMADQPVKPC